MDYKTGYIKLFNEITKAINLIENEIINNPDKQFIFDGIPKGVFDVMAILQASQQYTEELYMCGEKSKEKEKKSL